MSDENVRNVEDIDDFVDYKDFESNVDSDYEQDSFNKNIMKVYDDHKKTNNAKTSEIENPHRPISSYQRGLSAGRREEKEEDFRIDGFIQKFQGFVNKNKIKITDFIENPDIFLDFDEFKELFRNIKYEIRDSEIEILFNYNNKISDYLLGKTFLNNISIKWYEEPLPTAELTNFNIVDINQEFKNLKDEVLDIIEKEFRAKTSTKPKPRLAHSSKPKLRPITTKTEIKKITEIKPSEMNETKTHKSYLANTLKKRLAEEELLRLELEKRSREYEIESINKMDEANKITETLGRPYVYTAYKNEEENDNTLVCRIYNKDNKLHEDIDLKRFNMEFKKLKKMLNLNQKQKYYANAEDVKTNDNPFLNLQRRDRQEKIRQLLIQELESKVKLKRQLKAMRDKKIVDEIIIKSNLRFTNLDDNLI
jgi:hypothetical protein